MKERLETGARMLGALWGSGFRCESGWLPGCSCGQRSKFCIVKAQWVALAQKAGRDVPADRMIVEAMTGAELVASRRTITLDNGVKIGPKGGVQSEEAITLTYSPEAVPSVIKVLGLFPGARVVQG